MPWPLGLQLVCKLIKYSIGLNEDRTPALWPTDPISGSLIATTATLKDLSVGLASIPSEVAKTRSRLVTYLGPGRSQGDLDSVDATERRLGSKQGTQYAKALAIGSTMTLVRVTSVGLLAPFTITRDIGKGFDHVPRIYKDPTVREPVPITGIGSGVKAAGLGLGYGLFDGVTGLFVQPYTEAKVGGVLGFVKGCGMGLGGFVCKPTAGTFGLVGDVYQGAEQSWRRRRGGQVRKFEEEADARAEEREVEEASEAEREKVLEQWQKVCAAGSARHTPLWAG